VRTQEGVGEKLKGVQPVLFHGQVTLLPTFHDRVAKTSPFEQEFSGPMIGNGAEIKRRSRLVGCKLSGKRSHGITCRDPQVSEY